MNQTPENFEETRDLDPSPDSVRLGSTELHQELQDAAIVGILIGGKYKLIQRIGEGGMGTVWLAEQREPVRRKVAVKLVKAGMDSRQVLGRFDAERQALAVMDHPNIAKVFDGGVTEQGRPYFAMELVKGIPLTDYCDQVQYSVKERLELFIQVCSAVQHAHQKGIIHRDLKPSNILVTEHDGKPMVKVIDFGLAKALHGSIVLTDHSMHTAFGAVLGTPLYMAPEQLGTSALDVDTRADLYSLGVVLYELLTGTTPIERKRLKQAAWDEMCRMIREEEPPRPSTRLSSSDALPSVAARRHVEPAKLTRLVRGELDWIIMKTLEKDRNRRYETASGLGLDIHRYLTGEPVGAAPPSKFYRLRKFVRRNRSSVLATVLVFSALIAGMTGTLLGLREAQRQAIVAREEATQRELARAEEAKQRQAAERNLQYAQKGMAVLSSIFRNLDPERDYSTVADLRNALAENIQGALSELAENELGDPLQVASLQGDLGISLGRLGEFESAIELLTRAHETQVIQLGTEHSATLRSNEFLATCYFEAGDARKAISLLEETLSVLDRSPPNDQSETVSVLGRLAECYTMVDELEKAITIGERALNLSKSRWGLNHKVTATQLGSLASFYHSAGRLQEAVPMYELTLSLAKSLFGAEHLETLTAMGNLAEAYLEVGRTEQAFEMLEKVRSIRIERLGADHPDTLRSQFDLASAHRSIGQWAEAIPLYEKTLEGFRSKLGGLHYLTLAAMNHLGRSYQNIGDFDRAILMFEELLKLRTTELGPEDFSTLICMENLATLYMDTGRVGEGRTMLEQTANLMENELDRNPNTSLINWTHLAEMHVRMGKPDKAVNIYERLLHEESKKPESDQTSQIELLNNLAQAYLTLGRTDDALANFEKASLVVEKRQFRFEYAIETINSTISAYEGTRRFVDADRWRIRLLEHLRESRGVDSVQYANEQVKYAASLLDRKQWPEAEQALRESLRIRQQLQSDAWTTFNTMSMLGATLLAQDKPQEAEPLLLTGYEGMNARRESIPAEAIIRLEHAVLRLVDLYQRLNNPESAGKWKEVLAALDEPKSDE